MRVIGITGGVGSGKSRVLDYIRQTYHGAVYQADELAAMLQEPGQCCYDKIVEAFGEEILMKSESRADSTKECRSNRPIDRRKLAERVFTDKQALEVLEDIVHPAVRTCILEKIEEEEERGTGIFLLEAALLIEQNYEDVCQEYWYIHADEKVRRNRLMESRQYSPEKIDSILKNQLPEDDFYRACGRVIENSGTFQETAAQIDRIMEQIEERKEA